MHRADLLYDECSYLLVHDAADPDAYLLEHHLLVPRHYLLVRDAADPDAEWVESARLVPPEVRHL